MRDTRIKLFMQTELLACNDELDCVIKCQYCAVNNCPRENSDQLRYQSFRSTTKIWVRERR